MSSVTSSTAQRSNSSACAACRVQRRKCSEKCVLAPYFPPDDTDKFLLVRSVFGNRCVIKLVQGLPPEKRDEGVRSMVYEARERVRDPVHGCLGVTNDLHNNVLDLESRLVSAQAEVARLSQQNANLLDIISGYHERSELNFYIPSLQESEYSSLCLDDVDPLQLWGPLWT